MPFIVPAVVAAATAAIPTIFSLQTLGSLALSFGLSYVSSLLLDKPDAPTAKRTGGAKLDLRVDVDVPRSVSFGYTTTAGSLVYGNTYGKRGDVDNSDLIEIIAINDTPVDGFEEFVFVEGKKQDLIAVSGEFKVDNYEGKNGNQKLWIRFYDGRQTEADTLAVTEFGTADSRPWTSEAVGHGVAYARVHAAFDETKITGPLSLKFVYRAGRYYDPRKDSSVGGSGAHRFASLSTHQWTKNPVVMAYNILRGIYYVDAHGDRQFFYGLKRTQPEDLPLSYWFAAMNACDLAMSDTDETARYEAGAEITIDTEPRDAVLELLKSCGGRMTELGGVFKPYVDVPELPVLSFTDLDILDAEDTFKPVLPLEQRVNYITGKYTSTSNWADKIAPPRGDDDYEAEDGRRLSADLTAPMVQYGPQMQRLMRQFLKRGRRGRKHTLTGPPSWFRVEAGQVVEWTSVRNGYVAKLFEVDSVEYHSNLCVTLSITEVDPTDYDWEDDFKLPESEGEYPSTIPGPKVVAGFSVAPITVQGDHGTKKPGIELTWDDPADDDAYRVVFRIRRPTQPQNVMKGDSDEPQFGSVIITGNLAPDTEYEVSARFDSRSGYDSDWTIWMPVTTPDALLSVRDFEEGLRHEIEGGIQQKVDQLEASLEEQARLLAILGSAQGMDKKEVITKIIQGAADLQASFTSIIELATDPEGQSAIAHALQSLQAKVDDIGAEALIEFVAGVTPEGALSSIELRTVADRVRAGLQIIVSKLNGVKSAKIRLDADSILFGQVGKDGSFISPFVVTTGANPRLLLNGELLATSIKAASAQIGSLEAISTKTGRLISESAAGGLEITSNPPRLRIFQKIVP